MFLLKSLRSKLQVIATVPKF